mmetsp:Transcript_2651/g.8296  ORF Transcript_2651/g.8296 Transcript_2651/m.8296 type:complete len:555 (+) Transcript_2651:99-1763(+)
MGCGWFAVALTGAVVAERCTDEVIAVSRQCSCPPNRRLRWVTDSRCICGPKRRGGSAMRATIRCDEFAGNGSSLIVGRSQQGGLTAQLDGLLESVAEACLAKSDLASPGVWLDAVTRVPLDVIVSIPDLNNVLRSTSECSETRVVPSRCVEGAERVAECGSTASDLSRLLGARLKREVPLSLEPLERHFPGAAAPFERFVAVRIEDTRDESEVRGAIAALSRNRTTLPVFVSPKRGRDILHTALPDTVFASAATTTKFAVLADAVDLAVCLRAERIVASPRSTLAFLADRRLHGADVIHIDGSAPPRVRRRTARRDLAPPPHPRMTDKAAVYSKMFQFLDSRRRPLTTEDLYVVRVPGATAASSRLVECGGRRVVQDHLTVRERVACGVAPRAFFRRRLALCVVIDPLERAVHLANRLFRGDLRRLVHACADRRLRHRHFDMYARCRPQLAYLFDSDGHRACDLVVDAADLDTVGSDLLRRFGLRRWPDLPPSDNLTDALAPRRDRLRVAGLSIAERDWIKSFYAEDFAWRAFCAFDQDREAVRDPPRSTWACY